MNINDAFPSNYLKASDCEQPRVLTIKQVTIEEIGDDKDRKPVVHFHEVEQGLVLNRTNANMIAHRYGNETDQWNGKKIKLYVDQVSFQGRIVDAIRVKTPPAQQQAQPEPLPPQDQPFDDDLPF